MKAIIIGIISSFFFASSFVFNRAMDLSGGSWMWSASLRYLFMVPLLLIIVLLRGNLRSLLHEMRSKIWLWIGWSIVGFGLFYAPLCFAASYGPAWLVAGTWQITIIAGSLLVPLFYETVETRNGIVTKRQQIPLKSILMSLIILLGVVLMQMQQAHNFTIKEVLFGIIPVLLAAFAYPLGNRKMMAVCEGRLDAYQRVLGMTLASLPLWIILSVYGLFTAGVPSTGQTMQSFLVAICSGLIATVLFFTATDMVKGSPQKLAAVEATQSGELVFTVVGELWLLSGSLPSTWSCVGMGLVMIGMILHSFVAHENKPFPFGNDKPIRRDIHGKKAETHNRPGI